MAQIKMKRARDRGQALQNDKEGSYWYDSTNNAWFMLIPGSGISQITANVTEHPDRTITMDAVQGVTAQIPRGGSSTQNIPVQLKRGCFDDGK